MPKFNKSAIIITMKNVPTTADSARKMLMGQNIVVQWSDFKRNMYFDVPSGLRLGFCPILIHKIHFFDMKEIPNSLKCCFSFNQIESLLVQNDKIY